MDESCRFYLLLSNCMRWYRSSIAIFLLERLFLSLISLPFFWVITIIAVVETVTVVALVIRRFRTPPTECYSAIFTHRACTLRIFRVAAYYILVFAYDILWDVWLASEFRHYSPNIVFLSRWSDLDSCRFVEFTVGFVTCWTVINNHFIPLVFVLLSDLIIGLLKWISWLSLILR